LSINIKESIEYRVKKEKEKIEKGNILLYIQLLY